MMPFWRATLAMLTGAIAFNFYNTSAGLTDITVEAVVSGISMGVGSVLQAMFGAWLYRAYVSQKGCWDEPSCLLRFCLIVVVAGSTVAATVGSLTLFANGFIAADRIAFNWITWWAGDAIGVLLVTPMLQVLFTVDEGFSRWRKAKSLLPILCIMGAAYALFQNSVEYAKNELVSHLEKEANHLAHTIESRLIISENKLTAYSALFSASEHVTPAEFAQFSDRVMASDDGFHGIGWTEVLDDEGRARWENYFRTHGYPDFEFTELTADGSLIKATKKDKYYPVLYIHPFERNRRAFGLNLAANPARKTALLSAAETREPVATAPITLAQETENQRALIVYMPVFSRGPDDVLLGYASGVMRVNGILGESIIRAREAGLRFNLYDVTNGTELPIFESPVPSQAKLPVFTFYENFASRDYRVEIFPATDFLYGGDDWTSYVILTGGFIIAALFLIFILTMTGQLQSIQRQVESRTSELREAVSRANAASDAKSSFLANMSHELRTPLNAINGFLKLVLDTRLTSQQRDYLQKADLAAVTLLGLINQTLNYARIESGKMELEQGDVRMRAIARKMEALFGHVADEGNIEFSITLDNDVPDVLVGDELRVEQIVLNLLSNAFKFTREGAIRLIINYEKETSKLQIRVADTGVGIPADKIQHVFSAFGQADASVSRRFGGTGLGLSISRPIAQMMGGDILVRSTVDEGSEFCAIMYLPEGERSRDNIYSNDPKALLADKCVLIVEDIQINQLIVQEFLHKQGITTLISENGLDAVNLMQQEPAVDLILMDVQMPVMDGYTATEKIREFNASIPILGMTANAMDDDKKACLNSGMNDHIAKPIDPDRLRLLLEQWLAPQT
ncbi:MAG: CHASE domain-containing protein [Thalassolituus sp.]